MSQERKRICILGSTGSIGEKSLLVIADNPDRFEVVGLSAHGSVKRLAEQAAEYGVKQICIAGKGGDVAAPDGVTVHRGPQGLIDLVDACEPDLVVVATVGYAGLSPTLRAIELGVTVALANKEVLVAAGDLVMDAARRRGVRILPIDSEHNALFQCLAGRREDWPLRRLILTASGGPFRGRTRAELASVTVEEALCHPTWRMGRKITIDSATLMNKGFEVIETHHLFGVAVDKIDVVIHPQSVIHSMIEYEDGSMLAQLGVTDMYLPIANVLAWPERLPNRRFKPLNLAELGAFTFEQPDVEVFRCLGFAREAVRLGGTYPAVLNAANEIAVARFLDGEIGFLGIPELIEAAMNAHQPDGTADLNAIHAADRWARQWCGRREVVSRI
ncbi:1-deoxy-D-xylulose-5-phosphate reductoisomerase [bacterium]|nr:1-deoxy-D-xylulose-5-phosphate reductoisomerase [bacterium]